MSGLETPSVICEPVTCPLELKHWYFLLAPAVARTSNEEHVRIST